MSSRPRSRRAVLCGVGTSVGALAIERSGAAPPEEPDPDEYDEILDAMAGTGSANDPYVVTGLRELQAIQADPDGQYVLEGDIDASASRDWNERHGFKPVRKSGGRPSDGKGDEIPTLPLAEDEGFSDIYWLTHPRFLAVMAWFFGSVVLLVWLRNRLVS